MKRLLVAITLGCSLLASIRAADAIPRSHITCFHTAISRINLPQGNYGFQHGDVYFKNRHFAILMGSGSTRWKQLRKGDRVMTCIADVALPVGGHHFPIAVIDFDANLMFESFEGAEGV